MIKKAIKKNDDITEYLIFKTAVATGWDCPRAHILVKFREGKSEIFETQTIGRILRTVEAKHYGNEILDNAYIFTNTTLFETRNETYNPNQIKTLHSNYRKSLGLKNKNHVFDETKLISFYRSREGGYNSADSSYLPFFQDAFMNYFGFTIEDKKINRLKMKTNLKQKDLV